MNTMEQTSRSIAFDLSFPYRLTFFAVVLVHIRDIFRYRNNLMSCYVVLCGCIVNQQAMSGAQVLYHISCPEALP